jgi:hypothetical protein
MSQFYESNESPLTPTSDHFPAAFLAQVAVCILQRPHPGQGHLYMCLLVLSVQSNTRRTILQVHQQHVRNGRSSRYVRMI